MKLLIKNGLVIDPKNKIKSTMDVLLNNGKVAKVAKKISEKVKTIDAKGMIVTPGLIDMHVHLREPGREDKETIETCSKAAANGGITTIVGMPNTTPVADDQTVVKYVCTTAASEAVVNVYPVGNITKGGKGKELAQIGDLKRAGAIAVSDDGVDVNDPGLMRLAMEYLKKWKLPLMSHSEDSVFAGHWAMHEGAVSTRLGLPGKPAAVEEVAITKQIILSELTGVSVHFTHINSIGAVALIRDAKKRGINVTSDSCPHYFTMTDEAVVGYDANYKMNPPLRPQEHVNAIKKGLRDGTVDCIATDHAPHLLVDKYLEFENCANGIIGLDCSVSLVMTHLVHKKVIDMSRMVELMSTNPAKILNLEKKGHLSVGADADITIIDPKKEAAIDKDKFLSKGRNTPFHGWKVKGVPVYTIVKGKIVCEKGKVI